MMAKMEYNRDKYPKIKTDIRGFIRNPYNLQEKIYVELEDFKVTPDELVLFNNFNLQNPPTMEELSRTMSYSTGWISKIRRSMEQAIYLEFKCQQDLKANTAEEVLEVLEELYSKEFLLQFTALLQNKYKTKGEIHE